MKHNVVLLGSDMNVYYMARCYYEKYEEPVDVIATNPIRFTEHSAIVNIEYHPDLRTNEGFVKALVEYGKNHMESGKSLLIPCHDVYVRLLVDNASAIDPYFVYNCPTREIVDSFLVKEKFYKTYEKSGLPFARTIYIDCKEKETAPMPFDIVYPLIIKPSNAIEYGHHHFEGQPKVYKATTPNSARDFINKVKSSGYTDTLIVQEFIPGDDSALFDCVFYCNKQGKPELASFAQIGLQEHGPTAIGNCTVLINGYNQYGHTEETVEKLKSFLESIHYTGFCEFDLKYDSREGNFKVLEINPRQARSSYYLNALGCNLVNCLIRDVFDDEEKDFKLLTNMVLLSMVPKAVIKKYIANEEYKKMALKLWKKPGRINPLDFKQDKSFKHHFYVFMRAINYRKKYRENQHTI